MEYSYIVYTGHFEAGKQTPLPQPNPTLYIIIMLVWHAPHPPRLIDRKGHAGDPSIHVWWNAIISAKDYAESVWCPVAMTTPA